MRRAAAWALPALAVFAVACPLLLTSRSFGQDLSDHIWLTLQQLLDLRGQGHPSYYVQSHLGAFFPWFAFYGGTFYVGGAVVALVLGNDPVAAMTAVMIAAFVMAQLGWSWLSRQVGLRGWWVHAPGALYVTSAYYVTDAYGRGDVPELVATSSIPLLVASGLALFRGERRTAGAALAFVLAVTVFTGTHTLTLFYGVLFLVLVGALALLSHGLPRPAPRRRASRVVGLGALAVAINAWWLVPLALYKNHLVISQGGPLNGPGGPKILFTQFSSIGNLLRPLRGTPPIPGLGADVHAELPVLALLWCAAMALALRRHAPAALRRWFAGLCVLLAGYVFVMAYPVPLVYLPRIFRYIQFPYRLDTYALFCICGLVILLLRVLQTRPATRLPAVGLAAVLAVNAALAVVQAFDARSYLRDRDAAVASAHVPPGTWYIGRDYADASAPLVRPDLPGRLQVDTRGPRRDTYSVRLPAGVARPGTIATNVAAGPYIVDVHGAQAAGRTEDGSMVVRVDPARRRVVSFTSESSLPVRGGQAVSLAGLAGSVLVLLALAFRSARLRRRRAP